jgi:hypothetical protein
MRPWLALAAGSALYALAVLWSATRLPPDGVPRHFDASGLADSFSSRSEVLGSHITFGGIMLGLGVGTVCLARWGSLRLVNIPHKDYWLRDGRRPAFRRMLANDLGVMMGGTLGFLGLIPLGSVYALQFDPVGLPGSVMWLAFAAYMIALFGWCGWLAMRRYKPATTA